MLRKIFVLEREQVGDWKQSREFHNLYCSKKYYCSQRKGGGVCWRYSAHEINALQYCCNKTDMKLKCHVTTSCNAGGPAGVSTGRAETRVSAFACGYGL